MSSRPPRPPSSYRPDLRPMLILLGVLVGVALVLYGAGVGFTVRRPG